MEERKNSKIVTRAELLCNHSFIIVSFFLNLHIKHLEIKKTIESEVITEVLTKDPITINTFLIHSSSLVTAHLMHIVTCKLMFLCPVFLHSWVWGIVSSDVLNFVLCIRFMYISLLFTLPLDYSTPELSSAGSALRMYHDLIFCLFLFSCAMKQVCVSLYMFEP